MKIGSWHTPETFNKLVIGLSSGKTVLASSDTVLGLFAPLTKQGFNALNTLKNRVEKSYLVLISNNSKIEFFSSSAHSVHVTKLMKICWPGPLTLVFKAKPELPDFLVSKEHTIAIRVPDHTGLQELLQHFDGLFSTSANISGEPVPESIDQVNKTIKNNVDLIVFDREKMEKNTIASTILDCSGEHIKIIREGIYSIEELRKITQCPGVDCSEHCL